MVLRQMKARTLDKVRSGRMYQWHKEVLQEYQNRHPIQYIKVNKVGLVLFLT